MPEQEDRGPTCPACERRTVYTRVDGSCRCYTCGYDSRRDAEPGEGEHNA